MNLSDIADKAAKEIMEGFVRGTPNDAANQKAIAIIIYRAITEADVVPVFLRPLSFQRLCCRYLRYC